LLELFSEYGVPGQRLSLIWNNWAGSLINQFPGDKRTQIKSWAGLGKRLGGDQNLIAQLEGLLETPQGEDPISQLSQQVITIFSCREKAAHRAAERIMERNPCIDVRVCTDDRLTDQAKAHARNSGVVIVATACISHALTYGIGHY